MINQSRAESLPLQRDNYRECRDRDASVYSKNVGETRQASSVSHVALSACYDRDGSAPGDHVEGTPGLLCSERFIEVTRGPRS